MTILGQPPPRFIPRLIAFLALAAFLPWQFRPVEHSVRDFTAWIGSLATW